MRSKFQRQLIEVDIYKLSCIVRDGSGCSLILIPGSFLDFCDWYQVVSKLEHDFRIVVVELPGHGNSWPPPQNGSIEQFAQNIIEISKCLGLTSFYVGGHSIGGMIALEMGRVMPKRIKGIISVEGWTHWRVVLDAFGGEIDNTLSKSLLDRKEKLRKRVMKRWDKNQREEFSAIWKRWNGFDYLLNSRTPILEIWGDRGKTPPSRDKLCMPQKDNIYLHWIANASHFLPMERPEEVAEAINDFILDVETKAHSDNE